MTFKIKSLVSAIVFMSIGFVSSKSFAAVCTSKYGLNYYVSSTVPNVNTGVKTGIDAVLITACFKAMNEAFMELNGLGSDLCLEDPAWGAYDLASVGNAVPGVPNGTNGSACQCAQVGGNWSCDVQITGATVACCALEP